MGMPAGQLRHRLKFYRPSTARTATGAVKVGEWEHAFDKWGHFSHLSGKDILQGQVAQTNVTARAKIRHCDDIAHTMQVQYRGERYAIVGEPLADNRIGREYLTLLLQKVQND